MKDIYFENIENVFVVVPDLRISIDGEPLTLPQELIDEANTTGDVRIVRWNDREKKGSIETLSGDNRKISEIDYSKYVKPFIDLFKNKYIESIIDLYRWGVSKKTSFDTTDEKFSRIRDIRTSLLAATDYLCMPDYPNTDEELAAAEEYRQALRVITALEGAPWDGGGPQTPWPERTTEKIKAATDSIHEAIQGIGFVPNPATNLTPHQIKIAGIDIDADRNQA